MNYTQKIIFAFFTNKPRLWKSRSIEEYRQFLRTLFPDQKEEAIRALANSYHKHYRRWLGSKWGE